MMPARSINATDPAHNRCAWESDGEQCRYVGSIAATTMGSERWYCIDHFTAVDQNDALLGRAALSASIDKIPRGVDYSSSALGRAARARTDAEVAATRGMSREQAYAYWKASKQGGIFARVSTEPREKTFEEIEAEKQRQRAEIARIEREERLGMQGF